MKEIIMNIDLEQGEDIVVKNLKGQIIGKLSADLPLPPVDIDLLDAVNDMLEPIKNMEDFCALREEQETVENCLVFDLLDYLETTFYCNRLIGVSSNEIRTIDSGEVINLAHVDSLNIWNYENPEHFDWRNFLRVSENFMVIFYSDLNGGALYECNLGHSDFRNVYLMGDDSLSCPPVVDGKVIALLPLDLVEDIYKLSKKEEIGKKETLTTIDGFILQKIN